MHSEHDYKLESYDYPLPPRLITQSPAARRDESRLMVLRPGRDPEHGRFHDLPRLFRAGDVLALNETKVFPARLPGTKESGGKIEVFLLGLPENGKARALLKSSKPARPGARILLGEDCRAEVLERLPDGSANIRLIHPADMSVETLLSRYGHIPLPPYIRRDEASPEEQEQDRERYQTCYARRTGSVAAPTAGLHFTPELLDTLRNMGVLLAPLTLHVGYGTFAPVRHEDIREHKIHQEWVRLSEESAARINQAKEEGRRVWAVGTTTTRTLEFVAQRSEGRLHAFSGPCDLYICPGFRFQVVDNLVTNFHLPQSSLLFLVSALAGRERILAAYQEAVRLEYRFFSYGDAMAIVREE